MTSQPRIPLWFTAVFAIFFGRAVLFSTWLSWGPTVMSSLGINTAQMGILTMMYPLGGLIAVSFASQLVEQFGSRRVGFVAYALGGASLALLGFAIEGGLIWAAGALLILLGAPMAVSDYLGNFEGNLVDRASKHSLFPALHSSFGIGMMSAAALAGLMAASAVGLGFSFAVIGIAIGAIGCAFSLMFPVRPGKPHTPNERARERAAIRAAWRERRTLLIALIGFSFILAEISAGTWAPIALTQAGFTAAEAAFAFGMFWVAITVVRIFGGFAVDRFGRFAVVLASTLLSATGIALFVLNSVLGVPHLALIVWGAGIALGFPLSVLALGDNPARSAARINMIITVVYIASISVGPVLGSAGQLIGIYPAFAIPLVLLIVSASLSRATKPEKLQEPVSA